MRKRKRYTAEFKAQVVPKPLKEQKTLAGLSNQNQIYAVQISA